MHAKVGRLRQLWLFPNDLSAIRSQLYPLSEQSAFSTGFGAYHKTIRHFSGMGSFD